MSISALSDYQNQLAAYKPQSIVPDVAANTAGPRVRVLSASEVAALTESDPNYAATATSEAPGFSEMVQSYVKDVNTELTTSDRKQRDLMTGKTHDTGAVVASVEEANLTLQFALAIRNKLINAYQTISQMQY